MEESERRNWSVLILKPLPIVLIVATVLYSICFLVISGITLFFEGGTAKTIVVFVESFFLVVLPIFMSFAIFIFVKKLVQPISEKKLISPETINQSVRIINMVKNLFVGSIISYLSLSLFSDTLSNDLHILKAGGALIKLMVIALLILFWKILSKHA